MADLTEEEKRRAAAIAGLPISAVPDLTTDEGRMTAAGDFTPETGSSTSAGGTGGIHVGLIIGL